MTSVDVRRGDHGRSLRVENGSPYLIRFQQSLRNGHANAARKHYERKCENDKFKLNRVSGDPWWIWKLLKLRLTRINSGRASPSETRIGIDLRRGEPTDGRCTTFFTRFQRLALQTNGYWTRLRYSNSTRSVIGHRRPLRGRYTKSET